MRIALFAAALPGVLSYLALPAPPRHFPGPPARRTSLHSTQVNEDADTADSTTSTTIPTSSSSSIFIDEQAMLEGVDQEHLIGLAKRFLEVRGTGGKGGRSNDENPKICQHSNIGNATTSCRRARGGSEPMRNSSRPLSALLGLSSGLLARTSSSPLSAQSTSRQPFQTSKVSAALTHLANKCRSPSAS